LSSRDSITEPPRSFVAIFSRLRLRAQASRGARYRSWGDHNRHLSEILPTVQSAANQQRKLSRWLQPPCAAGSRRNGLHRSSAHRAIVWLSRNHAMQMRQSYGDLYRNKIAAFCGLLPFAFPLRRGMSPFCHAGSRNRGGRPRVLKLAHSTHHQPNERRVRSKWEGIYESWRRDDAGHRGAESRR